MTPQSYLVPALRGPFDTTITLPGSKSIALRQLAMAAVTAGRTDVLGIPPCDDTEAMLACLGALGVRLQRDGNNVSVYGPMDEHADVTLDARMSGASTRLLLGLAALRRGWTEIDGHASLRARTNAPLLTVLATHGCQVESADGCLPVRIKGPLAPPQRLHIDGSLSSQYVTALLVALPMLGATHSGDPQTIVIDGELVSRPYVDITLNEMSKRGVTAQWTDRQTLSVTSGRYQPGAVTVEGDATAATYFAALATLHGSRVELTNLGADSRQGDYRFLEIMQTLGADVTRKANTTIIAGPEQPSALPVVDMTAMPDAALTLITMAPLLPGGGTIHGLSSLHHKECDRLECPAAEFSKMGIDAETTYDSIRIERVDPAALAPHRLTTYHDHRMAMAFSIIGSFSGNLSIDDKRVVDKTYPAYWDDYARLSQC